MVTCGHFCVQFLIIGCCSPLKFSKKHNPAILQIISTKKRQKIPQISEWFKLSTALLLLQTFTCPTVSPPAPKPNRWLEAWSCVKSSISKLPLGRCQSETRRPTKESNESFGRERRKKVGPAMNAAAPAERWNLLNDGTETKSGIHQKME